MMKHVLVYGMTDNPGGIETYIHNFFSRVQGRKVLLDFVSDFPEVSGADSLVSKGARIHHIPAKSKGLISHWKELYRILREHREYETVYFNILDAGAVFTMLVPFLMGRRIVVHSHNSDTEKVRLHRLCRPVLNRVAKYRVACSSLAAEYMFGEHCRDALLIPNGIDAAKFTCNEALRQKKRAELGLECRFAVCHVGRISEQKNPMGLVDIFEEISVRCPNAVLVSVGDGELMDRFKSYIDEKKLSDRVMLLGVRQDVAEILQAADLFLFPSLYEGLPIALLEAQAAGLPCVISDTISGAAVLTDAVRVVSLKESAAVWADQVQQMASLPRKDTYAQIVRAGYDISCCSEFDDKLIFLLT